LAQERIGACVLTKFSKVADFDCTVREACNHFQLTAHGFNVTSQSGQIHVGSFFHFGNGRLLNMRHVRQHLLRKFARLAVIPVIVTSFFTTHQRQRRRMMGLT